MDAGPVDVFILGTEAPAKPLVEAIDRLGMSWRWESAPPDESPSQTYDEVQEGIPHRVLVLVVGEDGPSEGVREISTEARGSSTTVFVVQDGDPRPDAKAAVDEVRRLRAGIDLRRRGANATAAEILRFVRMARERSGVSPAGPAGSPDETGPLPPDLEGLIADLLGRDVERRTAALDTIDALPSDRRTWLADALAARLRVLSDPSLKLAADLDTDAARSWTLNGLVHADAEEAYGRDVIDTVLGSEQLSQRGRFWVLVEAHRAGVSYWRELAREAYENYPGYAMAALAHALLYPKNAGGALASRLASTDPEEQRVALWVLQAAPDPALVNAIGDLFMRTETPNDVLYEALYALSQPAMRDAVSASPHEGIRPGVLVTSVLIEYPHAHGLAQRTFVDLLAALDPAGTDAALDEARTSSDDPETAAVALEVSRQLANARAGRRRLVVAGFASDTADGPDLLGVEAEAEVLAAVLLSREVSPPLAVGLFGDWGTGKSFFMGQMQAATRRLLAQARASDDEAFCSDVAEVQFNAWHYVDTNLMASLVTHILEELSDYVSPKPTPEEREGELAEDLDRAKKMAVDARAAQAEAQDQRERRRAALERLHQRREAKERELRSLRPADIAAVLDDATKADAKAALEALGLPTAVESVGDLQRAAAEAQGVWGRGVGLARGLVEPEKRGRVLALVGIALVAGPLVALVVDAFVESETVATVAGVVAQLVAAVGAAAAAVRKASGWVAEKVDQLEAAKGAAEDAVEARRLAPSPEEQQLASEIAALEVEEQAAAERLAAATAEAEALDEQIQAVREGRSLAVFLGERLRSEDYHKHLGMTATIRRDFQALQQRLADPPEGARRVDRIVLYIDDLDRCPEDRVMEVLQAVHLLLAFPLFVVVVGVDPRWLLHALHASYSAFGADGDDDAWVTTPQNYLEKIFQIPFALRPMEEDGFGALMAHLLAPEAADEEAGANGETEAGQPADEPTDPTPEPPPTGDGVDLPPPPAPGESGDAASHEEPAEVASRVAKPVVRGEALVVRPHEAAFAARLHALIGTPRAVKRFTNVYRLLKAPVGSGLRLPGAEPVEDLATFEGSAGEPGTFRTPMVLLALAVGASAEAVDLFPALWAQARSGCGLASAVRALAAERDGKAAEAVADAGVHRALEALAADLPDDAAALRRWLPRVARYSFDLGRATVLRAD